MHTCTYNTHCSSPLPPQIPFEYTECDIHAPENKKWFDLYRYEIPVVHIDGEEAFRYLT
jgi:hypothetical protein